MTDQNKPSAYGRRSVLEGDFFVEGLSVVAEYARYAPQLIKKIYIKPAQAKQAQSTLEKFFKPEEWERLSFVGDRNRPESAPVEALVHHQNCEWDDFLKTLETKKPKCLVMLDQVTDTRNVGAIVRSAAFFGADAVIVMKKRQALLTQSSVQTARGGFALVNFVTVTNLSRSIEQLKERGYWVFGADMSGQDVATMRPDYEHIVLVLGAEDIGLSSNVRKYCDMLIKIPGVSGLDSLNVSVAAGILLREVTRVP